MNVRQIVDVAGDQVLGLAGSSILGFVLFFILKIEPHVFGNRELEDSVVAGGVPDKSGDTDDLSLTESPRRVVTGRKFEGPSVKAYELPHDGTFIVGERVDEVFRVPFETWVFFLIPGRSNHPSDDSSRDSDGKEDNRCEPADKEVFAQIGK